MTNLFKALKDKIVGLGAHVGGDIKDFVQAKLDELEAKLKWEAAQEAAGVAISRQMTLRPWKAERLQEALNIVNED